MGLSSGKRDALERKGFGWEFKEVGKPFGNENLAGHVDILDMLQIDLQVANDALITGAN